MKKCPYGAHPSAGLSLPEFPLLLPSVLGLVHGSQSQSFSLGTEPIQLREEAVHRWRNSEPDVRGRPEAHGCDQLHPPAVVKWSADCLSSLLPVDRIGTLDLSGCRSDVALNPT